MSVAIRRADRADLMEAYAIQREASNDAGLEIGNVSGSYAGDVPAKFRHECDHGCFLVAERDGAMLGFGGLFERGDVSFLATFYVRPRAQAARLSVGQQLLEALYRKPRAIRCVVSSHIYRALALYARNGLLPRWPLYMLEGESGSIFVDSPRTVEAVEAEPADRELLAIDARIAGRGIRETDQRYWLEAHCARPYWLHLAGRCVGYGYIQDLGRSIDAPWSPGCVSIGPVGVLDPLDAAEAVMALLEVARGIAPKVLVNAPGSHPALPALLTAGLRIVYQATFCCSAGDGPFDPRCYLPADTITF